MNTVTLSFNPGIRACAKAVQHGELIAYPTEAIWGLGCDPWNVHAVAQLLHIKNRPVDKGLIMVAGEIRQLEFLLKPLSTHDQHTIEATWPGHHTWVIPHHGQVLPCVSGLRETIAVRVSTHPVIKALCQHIGGPIISTSANPTGLPPARHRLGVHRYFAQHGLTIAPGHVGDAKAPSTIHDLNSGAILRT